MSAYKELARLNILSKMSDEERMMYLMMTQQEKSALKIQDELYDIRKAVERNKYSFAQDLGANVAGNAIFDGFIFLVSRLFKRIKP